MGAVYIDKAYVTSRLRDGDVPVLWKTDDVLDAAIGDASDYVRGMVRVHCRDGSAELGETTTDVIVKQATYAALLETAAAKPGLAWELAPNWETTPYRAALNAIEKGKLQISAAVDPAIAATVLSPSVTDYPQKTSRSEIGAL